MKLNLYFRFSLMFFLEWFIMGAWYITVGNYMSAIDMAPFIYLAYSVIPVSAIVSPYFLGMVADRYFSTEKLLGIIQIIGGVACFFSPFVAEPPISSVWLFLSLLMIHGLCFAPTMSLTSSLAFHHLTDSEKQFPIIRVFGTIGWIAGSVIVSKILHADETAIPLMVGGCAAVLMGLYCFTLPHTPPAKIGQSFSFRKVIDVDALKGLFSRPFVVFMACILLMWIPAAAYYAYGPVFINDLNLADPAYKMSFGQMSEIFFMIIIPLLFLRLGVKWMLAAGFAAWAIRYSLFALASLDVNLWMIMFAIIIHGICYDFLFVVGQIYIDKKSTASNRGQAQGLLILATSGIGQLLGTVFMGLLFNSLVDAGGHTAGSWQLYWFVPAGIAAVVTIAFIMLFHDKTVKAQPA